ncbi:DUF6624 domain-containing protein [Paraflavitalea pollutisoli]|uniref:DUF6624 domain-containing protein n=1 Tax=Paraflavitalea pollutisoli TaxID=3034143 RepID=UPI0023EAFDC5|nr:DUF6624 domain-containing protein [Paraflavitalea sp. H1-2-19X]
MTKQFWIVLLALLSAGAPTAYSQPQKRTFNKVLADSLRRMTIVDQEAANIRQGKYKDYTLEAWDHFKDSVFKTHAQILEKFFDQHGYPGIDFVGKEGEHDFWLMVQHSDHNPAFQEKVLNAMQKEVQRNNADKKNFAYLTDRLYLNTGRKQLYGTQVIYRRDICQAYPKPTDDSTHINDRRKAVGLPTVEEYLNLMTNMHFEMNKANMEERGIKGPTLYTVPKQ